MDGTLNGVDGSPGTQESGDTHQYTGLGLRGIGREEGKCLPPLPPRRQHPFRSQHSSWVSAANCPLPLSAFLVPVDGDRTCKGQNVDEQSAALHFAALGWRMVSFGGPIQPPWPGARFAVQTIPGEGTSVTDSLASLWTLRKMMARMTLVAEAGIQHVMGLFKRADPTAGYPTRAAMPCLKNLFHHQLETRTEPMR